MKPSSSLCGYFQSQNASSPNNHTGSPPFTFNYQSMTGDVSEFADDQPQTEANDSSHAIHQQHLASPSYQKVEGPINAGAVDPLAPPVQENVKFCRICLEDDNQDSMIAPCRCKGSSKWVHRDCLDEWRVQESDRAFSKCTECLFDYYLQPVYKEESGMIHRRIRFYWNVSKDVCLGTLVLQLIIFASAALIYFGDSNQALPNQIMPAFQAHPWSLYYLLGCLLLLIFVGIYGSGVLCFNGCSIYKSLPHFGPPSTAQASSTSFQGAPHAPRSTAMRGLPPSGATVEDRVARSAGSESNTAFYRRLRHRRQQNYHYNQRRGNNNNTYQNDTCCDSCTYCCNRQPILIYDPYGCCYGCCCCDDYPYGRTDTDVGCCDCCGGNSCSGGDGGSQDCGECVHVLLIILLIFAVILAVIGFFVGMVIIVIAFQRVVQRHIHLLQKKYLVQEYQVVDLQDYDLNQPLPTAPQEDDLEWNGANPMGIVSTPSAPMEPLPDKDVAYLQKLGLKE